MDSFFPLLLVMFFVNLKWQVVAIITTRISRTYGTSSKWAAPALSVDRSSKKWLDYITHFSGLSFKRNLVANAPYIKQIRTL